MFIILDPKNTITNKLVLTELPNFMDYMIMSHLILLANLDDITYNHIKLDQMSVKYSKSNTNISISFIIILMQFC